MKNAINRFERTLQTAERNYKDYWQATDKQHSHLSFGCAGHMAKSARKRMNKISDVRHELALNVETRKIMLLCAKCEPFTRKIINGASYIDGVQWEALSEILQAMNERKYYNDETDYYILSLNGALGDRLNAICYFIDRYGRQGDKKLISKFTF